MKRFPYLVMLLGSCAATNTPEPPVSRPQWETVIEGGWNMGLWRYYDRAMGVVCYATANRVSCVHVGAVVRQPEKP